MSTHTTIHKRSDSGALVSPYNGLPKLLPKAAPQPPSYPPRCRLLELPPDLRNIIYNFVFHEADGITIDFSGDGYQAGLGSISHLALTCQHFHHECRNLPYWLNTFHFRVPVLQDLSLIRAISPSMMTISLPLDLPPRDPSPRRRIQAGPKSLTAQNPQLREEAQRFVTMAMRAPHSEDIVRRLDEVIGQHRIISRLRRVHIHLGALVNNTFIERFFTSWDEVAPRLSALSGMLSPGSEMRLSFQLRLSRRLVVDYDFGVQDREVAVGQMDCCVTRSTMTIEELTLPELATINRIRTLVWQEFCLGGLKGEASLPRRFSSSFDTSGRRLSLQRHGTETVGMASRQACVEAAS